MLKVYDFRVAELDFRVCIPDKYDINQLLPSFRAFSVPAGAEESLIFTLTAVEQLPGDEVEQLLDDLDNDMGHTRLYKTKWGYRVELNFLSDRVHVMRADPHFQRIEVTLFWDDPYIREVLSSMLRIAFSQSVLLHQGISLHASAVMLDERAYLFMGKSGTGKSTHATLWQKNFSGCELLNDDNPTVRVENNQAVVYGTPWSGKTPCYKNKSCAIGGVVRLYQAPKNEFRLCDEISAFTTILPGCSVIRNDMDFYNAMCDTLVRLTELVRIGRLSCLPDDAAAVLCRQALAIENNNHIK